MSYVLIFLGIVISSFLYILSSAMIVIILGKRLKNISFGFGPILLSKKINNTEIIIRGIPISGSTSFEIARTRSDNIQNGDQTSIITTSTWSGVIILLTPIVVLFSIGTLIHGLNFSFYLYKNSIYKLIPIVNSISTSTLFAKEVLTQLSSQSLLKSIGTICIGFSAINSMPIPIFDGGKIIILILEKFIPINEKTKNRVFMSGCLISTILCIYWLTILYHSIFN